MSKVDPSTFNKRLFIIIEALCVYSIMNTLYMLLSYMYTLFILINTPIPLNTHSLDSTKKILDYAIYSIEKCSYKQAPTPPLPSVYSN